MFECQKKPKSFCIELKELHCNVYFLFIKDGSHEKQLKQVVNDLKRLGYANSQNVDEVTEHLDEILKDCKVNPGFTFELDEVDTCIAFRLNAFYDTAFPYFMNILAHETSHCVTFIFENIGLSLDDDEHRSITIGNIVEEFLEIRGKNALDKSK